MHCLVSIITAGDGIGAARDGFHPVEHHLTDLHAGPDRDGVHPARVTQLQGEAAAMPARVAPAGQQVLEAFTRAAGLQHKLSGDEVRQIEDLAGLGQAELPGLKQVWILSGVAVDAKDSELRAVGYLDHDAITQQHIEAGRVDQIRIERHDQRMTLAEVVDLVVGKRHKLVSKPTAP